MAGDWGRWGDEGKRLKGKGINLIFPLSPLTLSLSPYPMPHAQCPMPKNSCKWHRVFDFSDDL